jgi:isopentenyl diphosphate isomerase/L-lactate dehydrogenase-like FMN-dependent dehydrogenase
MAVLIGRATLYGTAIAGQAGAARAIEIYRDEIDRLLALIGCPGIDALNRDYLVPPSPRAADRETA